MFSLLPTGAADEVAHRLTIVDRVRLREGLSQVRDAPNADRVAAAHALVRAVREGTRWPVPAAHDEADCPFRIVGEHDADIVVPLLERLAVRDALEVAVTLCHLNSDTREVLWEQLDVETRSRVTPVLGEVRSISSVRTRIFARDVAARLTHAVKMSRTNRVAM